MTDILAVLVQLSGSAHLMTPPISLLVLSAAILGLILVNMSLGKELGSKLLICSEAEGFHRFVLWLYGLFDWPVFSLFQPRRKDRSSVVDAIGLLFGAALGLFLFVFVAMALVVMGEGLSRPFGHSAIAFAYLMATIAFARASMIGAVKRWYGIR